MACGLAGFVTGSALSLVLAGPSEATLAGQFAIVVAGALAFVAVVWITDAITGAQTLTFYHDALAVLGAAAATAAALGLPVLAHLDLAAIGLLVIDAFGRVGCTLVGCCHGRPARRGVVYTERHVRYGLAPHLVGRKLMPVPLYESAAAVALAAIGAAIVVAGAAPGTALAVAFGGYALVRIVLEELRGDWQRRQVAGASEPQWTSALLLVAIGAAAWPPLLIVAAAEAAAVAAWRRARRADLLEPSHVRELVKASRRRVLVTTSHGVRVSTGVAGGHAHVSLSAVPPGDDVQVAAAVAGLCLPPGRAEVVYGAAGVMHVVATERPRDG
jgi:prolipoprotein diacylglyceryltransferase